jgi:phosphate transport system substrate-binding protein
MLAKWSVPGAAYRLTLATMPTLIATAMVAQAFAETFIMQGASTFNRQIMEPHEAAIEAKSGHNITVIPNRTMLGIIALMEGRAHMAMISAPLEVEISKIEKLLPGLGYERLKVFEISRTRVAFIVNSANPVRNATLEQIKKVLIGEIVNWSALGGKDAPIRMAYVASGGGVVTSVESELLNGEPVRGPNLIQAKTALQLVGIVEQEPNVLGIAQLSLAKQKGLPEIVTESAVDQALSLVTLGEPTPAMKSVIDAVRAAVDKTM